MRSIRTAFGIALTWVSLIVMIWLIYGVLSQPAYGSENTVLKDTSLFKATTTQRPYGSSTITTGRITTYGQPNAHIYLKSYDKGAYRLTTGRIGNQRIHVKEYKSRIPKKD